MRRRWNRRGQLRRRRAGPTSFEKELQALVEVIQARGLRDSEALDRMREERVQEREENKKELLRMQEMMQQMREKRALDR